MCSLTIWVKTGDNIKKVVENVEIDEPNNSFFALGERLLEQKLPAGQAVSWLFANVDGSLQNPPGATMRSTRNVCNI